MRLEPRTLDDIRAFGTNGPEDEARFATAARVSEINKGLYRTFAAPIVRQAVDEGSAERLRSPHPHRLRFEALPDRNPLSSALANMAASVRAAAGGRRRQSAAPNGGHGGQPGRLRPEVLVRRAMR
jgi:hypothetical protein